MLAAALRHVSTSGAREQRRARQLTVKAEESRLSFALKRDFVDRKKRIEQARRRRAEERCMEKAAYTDGVRRQKVMASTGLMRFVSLDDSEATWAATKRPTSTPAAVV